MTYQLTLLGMLRYKELYGTFHPANAFIIPWTDDWPEEFWGYGLGSTVTQIRAGKSYLKRREELEAIGFSYLASILPKYEREYEYSYVRAALVRYQELHDHIRPKSDEVCQGDEWPKNLRGFKIGLIAPHIRSGRCWKDHREDLESIGFVFANSAGSDGGGTTKPWMSYEFPFIKRLLVHYAGDSPFLENHHISLFPIYPLTQPFFNLPNPILFYYQYHFYLVQDFTVLCKSPETSSCLLLLRGLTICTVSSWANW